MSVTGACGACGHEFPIADPLQADVRCPVCGSNVTDRHIGVGEAGVGLDEKRSLLITWKPPAARRVGRPKGSGRVIPDREYLRREYRRVRDDMGRMPTQAELADNMTDARDAAVGVRLRTLQEALSDFGLGWPPD